jgi:enoyl-CoA hydratase
MEYETLAVERKGETTVVSLHRPEKLNAINDTLQVDLIALCSELQRDLETRFVIVTGAGRAFSSGADVGGMRARGSGNGPSPEDAARLGQFRGQEMLRRLEQLEQITFACIHGYCLGGAVSIAMACDFRIATADAILGLPEAAIGAFYTWGSTPRLARLVGPSRAKEWIMTCENISGATALEWGLVDKVVPAGEAVSHAYGMIDKMKGRGPMALRLTKKLVNAWAFRGMADLFVTEPELMHELTASGEMQEGVGAFLEKRTPQFRKPRRP